MARLTAAQRRHLPSGMHYAGPGRSFPVGDVAHDRAALMDVNGSHISAAAKARVRSEARADLSRKTGSKRRSK